MSAAGLEAKCKEVLEEFFHRHPINKPPALEPFTPNEDALFHPLFKGGAETKQQAGAVIVPCKPDRDFPSPNLLLYDVEDPKGKETPVYEHINARTPHGTMMLYGTSGAGKTRSVFEYLSHNKGFYFVAGDWQRNNGSKDLRSVFELLDQPSDYQLSPQQLSRKNLAVVRSRVLALLYVRLVVHRFITEKLNRTITPYEWLLYQLYPDQLLGGDIFAMAFSSCVAIAQKEEPLKLRFTLVSELKHAGWHCPVPFIDEAQMLLRTHQDDFLSTDGTTQRSAFSALLKAFAVVPKSLGEVSFGFPVFSGTGMSFDDFKEQSSSALHKDTDDLVPVEPYFSEFQPLGVKAVEKYLRVFLALDDVRKEVVEHVAKWLRGRPRFTATFIALYLQRKRKTPEEIPNKHRGQFNESEDRLMEGLDRYITATTTPEWNDSKNRRYSGTGSSGNSAYDCIQKVVGMDQNDESAREMGLVLRSAIFKFALGDGSSTITQHTSHLIRTGVCATSIKGSTPSNGFYAELDEPLMVQAGINVYKLDVYLTRYMDNNPSGENFEKLLTSTFLQPAGALQEILQEQLGPDHGFQEFSLSSRSAYGVLARNCKIAEVSKTIQWIRDATSALFEGQVPPFCFPDDYFGADIIFLMWNTVYTDFRTALSQAKYGKSQPKQKDALLTLVPKLVYHKNRNTTEPGPSVKEEHYKSWSAVMGKLFQNPCLRMMIQYPTIATKMAAPGRIHDDAYTSCTTYGNGCNKERHDCLVVIDGDNGDKFFTQPQRSVLERIPGPPRKKARSSEGQQ